MLAKCANPACSTPFRRLSEGKLFQVETAGSPSEGIYDVRKGKPPHRIEHFWLCNQCAALVTLTFDPGNGILTVPLPARDLTKRVRVIDRARKPPGAARPDESLRAAVLRYRNE
jgi:hypothetical protein